MAPRSGMKRKPFSVPSIKSADAAFRKSKRRAVDSGFSPFGEVNIEDFHSAAGLNRHMRFKAEVGRLISLRRFASNSKEIDPQTLKQLCDMTGYNLAAWRKSNRKKSLKNEKK